MGIIFKAPGFLIWFVCGIWGTLICLEIVHNAFGTIFTIVSLILLPGLLGLAPWYEGLVNGNWLALMVVYGGGIGALILVAIGMSIDENK